ncbi:hypothetical protein CEP54_000271 [Fusarium duplospermum]|uniref:Uncharacterized protein n=1 Tax=Fusarium duplospermum TaxID=1325734 RepID=A0A428R8P5_9HYPO|nr:hypothetical protein CEP54_000271 [Fusarium duplospermum]
MVFIPLPDYNSPIFDSVQLDPAERLAHGPEVGDMGTLNIPDCLASIAIGKDIGTSNEPLSFSLQYMLLATRLAFDQGFRVGQASSSHATLPNNISTTEKIAQTGCDSSRHFLPQASAAGPGGDRPSSQLDPPDNTPSCINAGTNQIPRPSQSPGLHCLNDGLVSPLLNGLMQGFERELPSGLIPVLGSDSLEDVESDETQRGGRVSLCPQDSAPKDEVDHLPGLDGDDSRIIHDPEGDSEQSHRAQLWKSGDSLEDIEYIDLTIPEDQNDPDDKNAEADTIRVQTTPQVDVTFHEVFASGHNDGAGSVDKPRRTGPLPTLPERHVKRRCEDPSEQSISLKKQKRKHKTDFIVTEVFWAQGEEMLRYKRHINKPQQGWYTNDPIAQSLDLAEVYGEVLMSEHENVSISVMESEAFKSYIVTWDTQKETFWGMEGLGSDACHEFDLEVMLEKICHFV